MSEAGFWDNQERAAKVSAEHARTTRRLDSFRTLEHDVEDLATLAEMAEEDPTLADELADQVASVEDRLAALRQVA